MESNVTVNELVNSLNDQIMSIEFSNTFKLWTIHYKTEGLLPDQVKTEDLMSHLANPAEYGNG